MVSDSESLFHIHTYRCGHAADVPDEAYIQKAIALGAKGIWFTDHAPFPGDPFGNRMPYSVLPEYISSLKQLRAEYAGKLEVHIGLEAEYFPSFDRWGYYSALKADPDIELLLLGQHMAEDSRGGYTFSWPASRLKEEEYLALGNAIVSGIESGYFGAVAHPDRIFRRRREWSDGMGAMAEAVILAAKGHGTALEQNAASRKNGEYREEFWELAERHGAAIIQGIDAHSPEDLV